VTPAGLVLIVLQWAPYWTSERAHCGLDPGSIISVSWQQFAMEVRILERGRGNFIDLVHAHLQTL